jgi:hypothetical protein
MATRVASLAGADLTVASGTRVSLVAAAASPAPVGVTIDAAGVAIAAPRLTATHSGATYLSADAAAFRVASEHVTIAAPAGVVVAGPVQTPAVTSLPGGDLAVEALAQSLTLAAGGDATLASSGGSVTVAAPLGVTLQASAPAAAITLDAPVVRVSALAGPAASGAQRVCVCAGSGRLFSTADSCVAAAAAVCP